MDPCSFLEVKKSFSNSYRISSPYKEISVVQKKNENGWNRRVALKGIFEQALKILNQENAEKRYVEAGKENFQM